KLKNVTKLNVTKTCTKVLLLFLKRRYVTTFLVRFTEIISRNLKKNSLFLQNTNSQMLLCLIIVVFGFMENVANGDWWSLGLDQSLLASSALTADEHPSSQKISEMCNSFAGLSNGQRQFCMLHPDHIRVIGIGARNGIRECQRQFKDRRWNCSTLDNTTVFGAPVTNFASRESAFAYAISSAGVSYAIARACSKGHLKTCGCSRRPRPGNLDRDWLWSGCGDNLEYGLKLSARFVDNPEKDIKNVQHDRRRSGRSTTSVEARKMMNLHNNEAGRRVIYKLARVVCKCHGISGSCSLRTCWLQLPPFSEVGEYLKRKYEGAIEVQYARNRRLSTRDSSYVQPTKDDLVYIEASPDFCNHNSSIGSLGTQGRKCNKDSLGTDGCDIMCCGRGYNRYQEVAQEKCNCRFVWCCHVECDVCNKTLEYYACK
ncbi:hypothetical protein GJ496_000640, partial [Pomphorhynchus laevis]